MQKRQLAIVQGVGYANPNRSHFESMDIWHTCQRKTDRRSEGWLGRYVDSLKGSDVPAMHVGGGKQPLDKRSGLDGGGLGSELPGERKVVGEAVLVFGR